MKPLKGTSLVLSLLLVAILVMEASCWKKWPRPIPGKLSQLRKHWEFFAQHYARWRNGMEGNYCQVMMEKRNLTEPQCKQVHTFIHSGSIRKIRAVCGLEGKLYGVNGTLHRSQQLFRVTTCTLQGQPAQKPCVYAEDITPRHIVISCNSYGWPTNYHEAQIQAPAEGD